MSYQSSRAIRTLLLLLTGTCRRTRRKKYILRRSLRPRGNHLRDPDTLLSTRHRVHLTISTGTMVTKGISPRQGILRSRRRRPVIHPINTRTYRAMTTTTTIIIMTIPKLRSSTAVWLLSLAVG
ncbi:unnamed protein product [Linum trigynum]|uniref:Secreted protein n=1 Tax=Linum trigynum TaxID=586398 RepID=A0AAV2F1A9_9ROSI